MAKKKIKSNLDFSISFRFFDEKFDQIFGLTKKNYIKGLIEIDDLLKAKLGMGVEEILKKNKK